MRVLVCGSRNWNNRKLLWDKLDEVKPTLIISGGARGADQMAEEYAAFHGIRPRVFHADWELYGRRAGIVRNNQMLDTKPDLVLAFWDGESKGTKHTIDGAREREIPTEVILDE